jgi:hypothetical protein
MHRPLHDGWRAHRETDGDCRYNGDLATHSYYLTLENRPHKEACLRYCATDPKCDGAPTRVSIGVPVAEVWPEMALVAPQPSIWTNLSWCAQLGSCVRPCILTSSAPG